MVPRFQFSELSRNSRAVAAAADNGPVTITRRDGDELILMRKADADGERSGLASVAQVLAALASDPTQPLNERIAAMYPWVHLLPESDQSLFGTELIDMVRACASVAQFEPLATLIHAWQTTAAAYAAGWTDTDYDWLPDEIPVERPMPE